MPQLIDCPSGHRLKVPSKHAGHRIRCPVCDESVAVPPLPPPRKEGDARAEQRSCVPVTTASGRSDGREDATKASSEPISASGILPPSTPPGDIVAEPVASEPDAAGPDQQAPQVSPPLAEKIDAVHDHAMASQPLGAGRPEPAPVVPPQEPTNDAAFDVPRIEIDIAAEPSQPLDRSDFSSQFTVAQHRKMRLLGCAAIGVALVFAFPSLADQWATIHGKSWQAAEPWTYLLLLLAIVQISVTIYAMRLPDWSTSWCVAVVVMSNAAIHAVVLAMTNFARQNHDLLKQLGLLDEQYYGTAGAWCFLVICITLILAYLLGSFSWRWHHEEQLLNRGRS